MAFCGRVGCSIAVASGGKATAVGGAVGLWLVVAGLE